MREGIVEKGDALLGYTVSYAIHHTSEYGVPENRDRVIFIGVRKDIGLPDAFYEALRAYRKSALPVREVLLAAGQYGTAENPQTCTSNITLAKQPVMRKSPYAGMLVNGAGRPINLDGIAPTQMCIRDSCCAGWFCNRLPDASSSP